VPALSLITAAPLHETKGQTAEIVDFYPQPPFEKKGCRNSPDSLFDYELQSEFITTLTHGE